MFESLSSITNQQQITLQEVKEKIKTFNKTQYSVQNAIQLFNDLDEFIKKIKQAHPQVLQDIVITHQMALDELPIITKLRDTLDSDENLSIIKNHAALPVEFQDYDKEKVSELLRMIRNKVSISSQFRLFIS